MTIFWLLILPSFNTSNGCRSILLAILTLALILCIWNICLDWGLCFRESSVVTMNGGLSTCLLGASSTLNRKRFSVFQHDTAPLLLNHCEALNITCKLHTESTCKPGHGFLTMLQVIGQFFTNL